MGAAAAGSVWGSCRFCGTAVAPGASVCGECGADRPVPAGALATAPAPVRRRIVLTARLRALIVIALAVGLSYTLITTALSGEPNVPDPLTTTGTYTVGPGAIPILSGDVTGGDYIVGNFSSITPVGANVTISVYNSTGWTDQVENGTGAPVWSTPSEGSGRIIFTALVTDTYTFVLTNPYPASSHLKITVYVATEYESNVGNDGFG